MRNHRGALRHTEAEIASIQAEARRQADEITARYEAQAKREAEEIAARGRRSAEERQARLASVAQLDARKLELASYRDAGHLTTGHGAKLTACRTGTQGCWRLAAEASFTGTGVILSPAAQAGSR